jgi:hypothetical protein
MTESRSGEPGTIEADLEEEGTMLEIGDTWLTLEEETQEAETPPIYSNLFGKCSVCLSFKR